MTDFPSNSQRPRRALRGEQTEVEPESADKAKIAKVVEGEVVFRKKSLGKRLRETFITEDGVTIREYVVGEILIPAVRDLIYDVTIGSVERALFRDGRPVGRGGLRGRGLGPPGGIRYDLASRGGLIGSRREDPRQQLSRRARATHDFEEIVLPSRGDAEAVLTGLFDILEAYNEVKVSDLMELIGQSSNYAEERYGWTDLRGSTIHRLRQGGYVLELPRTEVLER